MSNDNWITEVLVQFIKSPVWLTPINDFIDDNCYLFTNEREMRLEYTTVYQRFQLLADNLLSDFVDELGVSLEDAMSAVRNSLNSDRESGADSRKFMKYIYLIDDFESFYRMMMKRNIELDVAAARALQDKGVMLNVADSEDILLSIEEPSAYTPEDIARILETNGEADQEQALKDAIAVSLLTNPQMQEIMLEEAKLQESLALSAQAERDRAQFLENVTEKDAKHVSPKHQKAEIARDPKPMPPCEAQAKREIKKLPHQALGAQGNSASQASEAHRQTARAEALLPTPQPKIQAPATADEKKPLIPQMTQGHRLPALSSAKLQQPMGNLSSQALPPIQESFCANSKNVPTTQQTDLPVTRKAPTEKELEERARHMRQQREMFIRQQKANRKQELKDYALEGNRDSSLLDNSKPKGERDAVKQLTVDIALRLREDILKESRS